MTRQEQVWGVYDTKDHCWMGHSDGPIRHTDELLARAAAMVINEQFGEHVRFRARRIGDTKMTKRDEIQAKLTVVEAIAVLERTI